MSLSTDAALADALCPFCSALVAEQVALPWPQTPRRCHACERWIGPNRAVTATPADAHCPHCHSLAAERVGLPWPPAPRQCSSCERWIGRYRAAAGPDAPATAQVASSRPPGSRRRARVEGTRSRRTERQAPRARRTDDQAPRARPAREPSSDARDASEVRSGAQAAALSAGSGLAQTSLRFYEVTLRGCERVLGADHPQTLATRHDLAGAHLAAGDVDAAIGLYEATLAKREAVLGVDHPDTEATRDELADATRRRGTAQRDAGSPPSSLTRAANGEAAGTRSAGPAAAREHLAVLPRRAQSALAASGVVPRIRTRATLGLPRPRLPLRGRRGETRPEDARTPLGRLVRTAAVLMLVFGTLVITDAVVTLFWQEPITAVIAAHNQGRVNHKLDSLLAAGRAREARQRGTRRMIAAAAAALDLQTPSGEPLGQIRIPRIGIKFAIVQGEDEASLERGPGHYPQTPLPGAAGRWTVGIAGHRTTYLAPFRNIDQLRRGDPIFVTMPYARFTYVVERTVIVDPSDQTIFTAVGYNRLALSACNPPFSAAQRIIVYARQTRMAPLVRVERAHRSHHSAIERIWRGVLA